MKYLKTFFIGFLGFALVVLSFYILGVLYTGDIEPAHWTHNTRGTVMELSLIVGAAVWAVFVFYFNDLD